ncbi:MAG: ABC transporter ATP-binding protein [Firmicutes bacterium]|jgi:ABC-2 type transport system ATP-binding protein|nr:ABC transporter ATP-binding protein [Bacillota bacterium]MDH7496262.1 ABC transporter ATP-binding protein [Bacillota bacterium]
MRLSLQRVRRARREGNVPGVHPGKTGASTHEATGEVALRTVGLTRVFGRHRAVDSVSLEIKAGEVFGFLGPNGAGKTTTINMILGLVRPTAGHVEILGQRAGWASPAPRRMVGSLLGGVRFYPHMGGRENLRVFAAALGGVPERRIDEVLDLVGLADRARDKVGGYSQGMRRRLGLAVALLRDPAVLVLDEPANGLDPGGIKDMRDLVRTLAAQGKAVFLSSHLLHEVEMTCDRVAILRRGVVLAQGRVSDLLSAAPAVEIRVDCTERAEGILRAHAVAVDGASHGGNGDFIRAVQRDGDCLVVEYAVEHSAFPVGSVDAVPDPGGVSSPITVPDAVTIPDAVTVRDTVSVTNAVTVTNAVGVLPRAPAALPDVRAVSRAVAVPDSVGVPRAPASPDAAYRAAASRLNALLASQDIFAHQIQPRRALLEEVFFDVLGEGEGDSHRRGNDGQLVKERWASPGEAGTEAGPVSGVLCPRAGKYEDARTARVRRPRTAGTRGVDRTQSRATKQGKWESERLTRREGERREGEVNPGVLAGR